MLQRPGIQRIFVHDYAAVDVPSLLSLKATMAGCYAERGLVMAQRGDVVVVLDPVDANYLRYLDEVGIGPGADGVVVLNTPHERSEAPSRSLLARLAVDDRAIVRVAEHIDGAREPTLSPYFASPVMTTTKRKLERYTGREVTIESGSVAAVDLANRKDSVRGAAQMLGVPMPDGEVCSWSLSDVAGDQPSRALLKAIARHMSDTGGVMIRGAWSMHGVDNLTIADGELDVDVVRNWLAQRQHLHSYLVETRVPVVASPNLQLWISDDGGRVEHLATTKQRLDTDFAYRGSEFPHCTSLDGDLIASAETLGRWISSIGYRGPLGIDFIETVDRDSGALAHLFAEVNGRINGATYALALSERINQIRVASRRAPMSAWITNTELLVRARSFGELRDRVGDLIYTHAAPCGVVPYNTGLLRHGQVNVAIVAATIEDAKTVERELIARVGTG